MMAHDSGPTPPPQLSEQAVARIRTALASVRSGGPVPPDLSGALAEIAREARTTGVPPEQLLVALKDSWYALPEFRRGGDVAAQARTLQALVTLCIKEYYARD